MAVAAASSPAQGAWLMEAEQVGRDRGPEGDLPVFDAAEASRLAGRSFRDPARGRRTPERVRSVGIAVAALVVLTAAVAIGGILEASSPEPSGSPAATPDHAVVDAACTSGTAVVPAFVLVAEGTTDPGRAMLVGFTHRPDRDSPSRGWRVPGGRDAERALTVGSGTILELLSQRSSCIRHVAAEYASAALGGAPGSDDLRRLMDGDTDPAPQVQLGALPDGDWVVRAVAYFETGISGPEGLVYAERFFRVRVGSGPFATAPPTPQPDPTPLVTPAVGCGPHPAGGDAIEVVLRTTDAAPVPGVPENVAPAVVSVSLGEDVELSVAGDACAIAWQIEAVFVEQEDGLIVDSLSNPGLDPAYALQNRWLLDLPVGDFRLVAELTFEAGIQVSRSWHVVGRGFDVPDVFLTGADGTRVAALPGCGLSIELANGYKVGEQCVGIGFPAGLEVMSVPAWTRVAIEVSGWTLLSWSGVCGTVVTDDSGSDAFELGGCGLGGFSVEPGDTPPGPAQFLARPGPHAVQIYVSATLDGNLFAAPVYGLVNGR